MKLGMLVSALGGIGGKLLGHLANAASFHEGSKGPVGRRRSKVRANLYLPSERTFDKRHWHDPSKPEQAARIEAAKAKRERRAEKRARNTTESVNRNWAHGVGKPYLHATPVPALHGRLNPFYVNRETA